VVTYTDLVTCHGCGKELTEYDADNLGWLMDAHGCWYCPVCEWMADAGAAA
jgi:transposase